MIVLATLLFGGCKRYLDVTPQGKIIPETEEDFEALLNNMLYAIEEGTDEDILGCYDRVILYESISDNLDANISAGRLTLYAGDVANNFQKGYYEGLYSAIKDCNLILEYMLEKDSAKARALCAAAYAIKGVCYYNLIRIYCEPYDAATASSLPGIPIVEHFDVESDAVPDRNTLARSYEYAVSLLRKAVDYHMTDESYLFTEAVAKAYLAKLYFWAEEWSEVIPLCEELLAVPSYALADRSVYTESIQSYGEQLQEVIIRDRTTGDDDVKTLYDETFRSYLSTRPVNATLLKLFGAEPQKDIRWGIMCDAKRVNQKTVTARIRGSELHLMLAESYAHPGAQQDEAKALSLLNELRRKRIEDVEDYTLRTLPEPDPEALITVDATGQPLTPLISAILDERRKELYMEGDRWFELKRNGRPEWWVIQQSGSTLPVKYVTRQYLYTMPVSVRDIRNSQGQIAQNPGYEF